MAGAWPVETRHAVIKFLTVPEFVRCSFLSREWREDVDTPVAWCALYALTQQATASERSWGNNESEAAFFERLVKRPFGNAAIGWTVVVQQAPEYDGPKWRHGTVMGYSEAAGGRFLVNYHDSEGGAPEWETERHEVTPAAAYNPAETGKSRFFFLEAPVQPSVDQDGDVTMASDSNAKTDDATLLNTDESLILHGGWRQEVMTNHEHVPTKCLGRIAEHTDEVLYIAFSHSGSRFATCSRDKTTVVWELDVINRKPEIRKVFTRKHRTPSCRVVWAPDDKSIMICTEEVHHHEPAEVEVVTVPGGGRILALQNKPFDVYGVWTKWPPPHLENLPDGSQLTRGLAIISGKGVTQGMGAVGDADEIQFRQLLQVSFPHNAMDPTQKDPLISVPCRLNFHHCLENGSDHTLVAMTGKNAHLCDQLAILDLKTARYHMQGALPLPFPMLDISPTILDIDAAVLSARWSRSCRFLLVNARPFVGVSPAPGDATATEPPDISTSIELQIWDPVAGTKLQTLLGHHAFTIKQSPFLIFTDDGGPEEAPDDYLASGGEDHRIYIWHRRHNRLMKVLHGHTEAVNAVSWCQAQPSILMSSSDDHTVRIWGRGAFLVMDGEFTPLANHPLEDGPQTEDERMAL